MNLLKNRKLKGALRLLLIFMMLMSITACSNKDVSDVVGEVVPESTLESIPELTPESAEINDENTSKDAEEPKVETLAENEKYLLTEKKRYNADGSLDYGTKYEYNQIGTLIKTTYTYMGTESIIQEAETYDDGSLKVNIDEYGVHYEYNEAGQLTESYNLMEDGVKFDHYIYEYNEYGDKIRCEMTSYEGETSVKSYQYEYDEAGNKKVMECYENGVLSFREEYDEAGTLRKEIMYNIWDGTIYIHTEYDAKGREILYKSDGTWIIREFSEDEKMVTRIMCDSDGNPVSKETYDAEYIEEYDEKGNLLRTLTRDYNGLTETNYSTNGNMINKNVYAEYDDGSREKRSSVEYEYDENNNLIKETGYDEQNQPYAWIEYTYGKYTVAE